MANVDLAAATDTAAPKLVLGGPRSQRALRQKGIVLSASCNEACALRASGTVALSRPRIVLPLRAARAALDTAGQRTLRLALSRPALARLERALRQGNRGRANVTVRAVDRAGNASSATRSFRLIP